jgi:hypothetical protein
MRRQKIIDQVTSVPSSARGRGRREGGECGQLNCRCQGGADPRVRGEQEDGSNNEEEQ